MEYKYEQQQLIDGDFTSKITLLNVLHYIVVATF